MDLHTYLQFAEDVENTINTVPSHQVAQPIDEGKWSPFQLLQHITDSEIVYFRRIKRVLVEDNPHLIKWHPTEWLATEPQGLDLTHYTTIINAIRHRLYHILKSLLPEDWDRPVVHPRFGDMTLESLVQQQIDHGSGHLQVIKEFISTKEGKKVKS